MLGFSTRESGWNKAIKIEAVCLHTIFVEFLPVYSQYSFVYFGLWVLLLVRKECFSAVLICIVYSSMKNYCKNCKGEKKDFFATDTRELFTLRACLVNVLTELHFDSGDVKGG